MRDGVVIWELCIGGVPFCRSSLCCIGVGAHPILYLFWTKTVLLYTSLHVKRAYAHKFPFSIYFYYIVIVQPIASKESFFLDFLLLNSTYRLNQCRTIQYLYSTGACVLVSWSIPFLLIGLYDIIELSESIVSESS